MTSRASTRRAAHGGAFARWAALARWAAFALALAPLPAAAQFPAELAGRVIDAGGGQPIFGALVEIEAGARAATDAGGAFLLRHGGSGPVRVLVTREGYESAAADVVLESGRTARVTIALDLAPLEIAPLEVVAVASHEGGYTLGADAIAASGARTLGDLVKVVPGVVVRPTGAGGQRASIRGAGADAVLVLVDGAPLNDPLTGEADLSLVPLTGVASVRVLPGARTARYGPRAEAGVILVETRGADPGGAEAAARLGSFGEHALAAEAGLRAGGVALSAGLRVEERAEAFDYDLPPALGGGSSTRANAEQQALGAFAALAGDVARGPLRVRVDAQTTERGLPGPLHALTPEAGQHVARAGVAAGWRAPIGGASLRLDGDLGWQRMRHEDPAPAFGPAYFDTTRALEGGLRIEAERAGSSRVGRTGVARSLAAGAELRASRLESTTLSTDRLQRIDPGVFARAGLVLADAPLAPGVSVGLRADRWANDWIGSHEVALHATLGAVTMHAAHRSAFSPPTASDQYFRSGLAIAPNPDLAPERVPAEIEAGATAALRLAGVPVELGANGFRGDIDGMIVWAPDFRFVWSPRNRDVRRSGGEAWLRAEPVAALRLGAWASVARVTYDWPGDADTVQVVYRPRLSGGATLDWQPERWRFGFAARYTGVRYATPGHANPLPGYWDLDASVARDWRVASAALTTRLMVERLLDNTDAFVHGYPEPGRRLRLELRLAPWADHEPEPRLAKR